MRRASWTDVGLDVVEGPSGPLDRGWARLRVEACGICGSDLHTWHRRTPRRPGLTPGHEFVGYVVDAGESLADVRYVASPFATCGRCGHCVSGNPQRCAAGVIIGFMRNGGMAEEVDVPIQNLVPVPAKAAGTVAAMTEPVAVAVRGLGLAGIELGSRVLIVGGGTLGLISALLTRGRCAEVAVVARYPHQLDLARRFGATPVPEADLMDRGSELDPDVIIETVGGQVDLSALIGVARPGGRIVMLGLFDEKVVNLRLLMMKEISIVGSMAYGTNQRGSEFVLAADLVAEHPSELSLLQTHQFSLAQASAAFRATEDKSLGLIKATVVI